MRHRIEPDDIRYIVYDLGQWAKGKYGVKLTWAAIVEKHGFTRQSLQSKAEIKVAYVRARERLAGGMNKQIKDNAALHIENEALKRRLAVAEKTIALYHLRWQRVAHYIAQKNMSVTESEQIIPAGLDLPSLKEATSILKPFMRDIPPTRS